MSVSLLDKTPKGGKIHRYNDLRETQICSSSSSVNRHNSKYLSSSIYLHICTNRLLFVVLITIAIIQLASHVQRFVGILEDHQFHTYLYQFQILLGLGVTKSVVPALELVLGTIRRKLLMRLILLLLSLLHNHPPWF